MVKRQFLQFLVKLVKSQAVGDRCIDFQRFAGDSRALLRLHDLQCAHVVQPVGEFDQDYAHVACHGEQHLAEILCLRLFLGLELDPVELGDAIHEISDVFSELVADLGLGDGGVLHHVVKQRRGKCLAIKMPLRQDVGYGYRMGNVGIARLAELALMRGFAELVCTLKLNHVLRLQIAGCILE